MNAKFSSLAPLLAFSRVVCIGASLCANYFVVKLEACRDSNFVKLFYPVAPDACGVVEFFPPSIKD
jgi:hypothetical protein